MNAINGAEQNVLALDAQRENPADGAEFQQSEYTSDAPSMTSASDGGACPQQHAPSSSPERPVSDPNPFPRGRWTSAVASMRTQLPPLSGLIEAPLRELFWSPPETSMVEEATQRIAALMHAAANAVQEIQLFDDVYEVPAC